MPRVVRVSEPDVRVRMDRQVAVAELVSGPANALDTALCLRIAGVFGELARGPARAVVLTGAGAMFSAGVDLIKITEGGPAYVDEFLPALEAAFMAVFSSGLPVVAAVNGHAIAGGCILVSACDYRIMNGDAGRIGVTELLVGVPFPAAAMEILRFAVGTPRLSSLIMSGQTYEAADAVGLGLVDEAAGADDVLPRAVEAAGRFAALHPPAASQARRQIRGRVLERIAAQSAEDEVVHAIWRSPEALDAIGAYVARVLRSPA
jgi:enoyl-CoA hydratase/carnithine racemase